jgi:fatty-acyl-CoA synthase
MRSTMQDGVLSITSIFEFGANQFPNSKVVTYLGDGDSVFSFTETAKRVNSLANALASIGVNSFDRVGTFAFNNQQHLEAYLAVPSMGAVLHTLNLRLFQEQLTFVINDAEDKVIISDGIVLPLLAKVLGQTPSVQALIIAGSYDPTILQSFNLDVYDYEELISAHSSTFNWPKIDEFQAAAMCYTSGTTGNPKGVVYSHRSTWLHSSSACTANTLGFSD